MNKQEAIDFLFIIASEIRRSFETPVILLTMQDYAERVFNSLTELRTELVQQAAPERIAELVGGFHLDWLQAVQDIDQFKRRIRDTPRDFVNRAIDFTVDCVKKRQKYLEKYIDRHATTMTGEENKLMQDDLGVMVDMHENVIHVLRDKEKCFFTLVDQTEYFHKVMDETEELLNWLDVLNDNLAIQYSKVVGFKFPELTVDLSKTLRQIIAEVSSSTDPEQQKIAKEIEVKSRKLSCLVRLNSAEDLEIRKILEKIKNLEDRIDRLKSENSSAVMALQHKTIYLEERLQSLENLKESLLTLKYKHKENLNSKIHLHIFDHLLPQQDRCRLVNDLMKLWNDAICGVQEPKSIISILSVNDLKEIFSDDLGKFTVDRYGRKLYKGDDGALYQLNERNELVVLKDDEKRVYFYDDCGRYYISESKERIYKDHENASEYLIDREGKMLKFRENREGKEFWFDNLGRYFYNESGNRIYCDNSNELYVPDGLGNLVRLQSQVNGDYVDCPIEPVETEESKYLQQTVGIALRKCLATVVIHQPENPIQFLAKSLEAYRWNMKAREDRAATEAKMMVEREKRMREEQAYLAATAPASSHSEGEAEYADPNFIHYQTMLPES